jgi:hypothetical protein
MGFLVIIINIPEKMDIIVTISKKPIEKPLKESEIR